MTADEPLRILCVGAHPDDIEFGCAGSVARWVEEGAEVTYVIATDGSTGTDDPEMGADRLAAIRRKEAQAAAEAVGVEQVDFLGFRDGYVEASLELRRELARAFRRLRPHRLMCMDPTSLPGGWFVNHPDHRAVGQACLDITVTAGTTLGHFPELRAVGLEPWRGLREIFIMGPGGGPTAIDITTTVDRKIEALRCHASQVGEWDVEKAIRDSTRDAGEEHGMDHAERFQVIVPLGAPSD